MSAMVAFVIHILDPFNCQPPLTFLAWVRILAGSDPESCVHGHEVVHQSRVNHPLVVSFVLIGIAKNNVILYNGY